MIKGDLTRVRRYYTYKAEQILPLGIQRKLITAVNKRSSPYVPADDERHLIFIHVPKAAGSSLKTLVYGSLEDSPQGHRRIIEYYISDAGRANSYLKVAFVRNPWDRLLSAHNYLMTSHERAPRDIQFALSHLKQKGDFEEFVLALGKYPIYRRAVLSFAHFLPQNQYICLPGQKGHSMDFLGRFERIVEDTEELKRRLGIKDNGALPRVRTSNRQGYRDSYSDKMRDLVSQIYARDIEIFGYSF